MFRLGAAMNCRQPHTSSTGFGGEMPITTPEIPLRRNQQTMIAAVSHSSGGVARRQCLFAHW